MSLVVGGSLQATVRVIMTVGDGWVRDGRERKSRGRGVGIRRDGGKGRGRGVGSGAWVAAAVVKRCVDVL